MLLLNDYNPLKNLVGNITVYLMELSYTLKIVKNGIFTIKYGCCKEEYERRKNPEYVRQLEERKKLEAERKALIEREEKKYAKRIASSTDGFGWEISKEKVIAGLKFIAEHLYLDHSTLARHLRKMGCEFSCQDIKSQMPGEENIFDGMSKGCIGCGASVIANIRDSEFARTKGEDWFFGIDDETSAYHFIRLVFDSTSKQKQLCKKKKSE